MIHRQALAPKTLPEPLQNFLKEVIKTVNCVKSGALNTRIFRKRCANIESEHLNLLYDTEVRWLSKGNVVGKVFELSEDFKKFLIILKKSLNWDSALRIMFSFFRLSHLFYQTILSFLHF